MIVRLSKVANNDLVYLVEALRFHYRQLQTAFEATPGISIEDNISITLELFNELDKKASKQFPPQNTSIVLYKHKARLLIAALHNWQQSLSKVSYEANKALIYKNLLLKQTNIND